MNVSSNGKVISAATHELSTRWTELENAWRDVKAREFEERFLTNLVSSVERATPVFDQLQRLLNKIREECE